MSGICKPIIAVSALILLSTVFIFIQGDILFTQDHIYGNFLKMHQDKIEHPLITAVSNTDLFQRLEKVSQLSESKFINKDINITRKAHSLGVCKLAGIYVNILNENSKEQINMTQKLAVKIAGLCHDIGHGPFSHLFEKAVLSLELEFDHENQSVRIVRKIFKEIDQNLVNMLPNDFVDAVCDMIVGISEESHRKKYENSRYFKNFYLFTIVNGQQGTEIDVDKLDYMMRDTSVLAYPKYFLKLKQDIENIVSKLRIEEGIIKYDVKSINSLVNFSHQYYLNYRYSYYGAHNMGASLLLADIIKELVKDMDLQDIITDLNKYVYFTDEVFEAKIKEISEKADNSYVSTLVKRLLVKDYYYMKGWIEITIPNITEISPKTSIDQFKKQFESLIGDEVPQSSYVLQPVYLGHVLKGNKKSDVTDILKIVPFYNKSNRLLSLSEYLFENCQDSTCGTEVFKYLKNSKYISYDYDSRDTFNAPIQIRLYLKTSDLKISKKLFSVFDKCARENTINQPMILYKS